MNLSLYDVSMTVCSHLTSKRWYLLDCHLKSCFVAVVDVAVSFEAFSDLKKMHEILNKA